ncbi:MAG TPA: Sapep family Mn(2+)-dependent dipeptidase [Fimbriimonadaceae bacterium]|nr:Sapep family Mn(2+)-dependent dipeptidase [Fimbriimonadaceae bacterium]
MIDPNVQRIQQWLRDHEQELLDDTRRMLQIPSLEEEALPNAPFGAENRRALDLALEIAGRWGMKTKDIEGYIGYAEFGEGEPLIVSLGHLDVVPVGPGWKHEPFGAEIDEGYVYARGATDDKGPTMASFYAARAIQECCPELKARIRVVFGCNEESGFGCVKRYVQTEEAPTLGVAPDSGWPLYHAEKGIANIVMHVPLGGEGFQLLEASGGQRPNIVIDTLKARVAVSSGARKHVETKLADAWDRNVTWSWSGDELHIEAVGKAAHGSRPFDGDSAATRAFRFLREIAPLSAERYYDELMESCHPAGSGLGIHGRDDVSELTCNVGIVETEGCHLRITYNIRYPVTWKGDHLQNLCLAHLKTLSPGWEMAEFSDSPSLYFPLDHPLVKTICDVYLEETGEEKQPGVMGGGTYARAIPNTVSIGTGWEGDGRAHETDERLKIENLYRMSRIYGHILYRLAKVAGG